MTVWTCNVLCRHRAAGDMRPRLWGDDENELLVVLYGIGASLDDVQADHPFWENYLITPEQQVLAVDKFGAVVTDYLEPRRQLAVREGDGAMVAQIDRTRLFDNAPRLPLLRDPLARGVAA